MEIDSTILNIVKELSKKEKNIEYVILESPEHNFSFQPNYERLDVGDVDLFNNVVVKKISYYNETN